MARIHSLLKLLLRFNAPLICEDCGQEIATDDWEPCYLRLLYGHAIQQTAICRACVEDLARVHAIQDTSQD